jgi:hypothetical protein
MTCVCESSRKSTLWLPTCKPPLQWNTKSVHCDSSPFNSLNCLLGGRGNHVCITGDIRLSECLAWFTNPQTSSSVSCKGHMRESDARSETPVWYQLQMSDRPILSPKQCSVRPGLSGGVVPRLCTVNFID